MKKPKKIAFIGKVPKQRKKIKEIKVEDWVLRERAKCEKISSSIKLNSTNSSAISAYYKSLGGKQ